VYRSLDSNLLFRRKDIEHQIRLFRKEGLYLDTEQRRMIEGKAQVSQREEKLFLDEINLYALIIFPLRYLSSRLRSIHREIYTYAHAHTYILYHIIR